MFDVSTASNSYTIFMVGFVKSPNAFVRRHSTEVFYITGSADDVLRTLNIYQPRIVMLNMEAPQVGGVGMLQTPECSSRYPDFYRLGIG